MSGPPERGPLFFEGERRRRRCPSLLSNNKEEQKLMNDNGFASYELREELLLALKKKGFSIPTPVQEKVLALDNFETDLIVRAKTGSGKTLAFLLPLLQGMELPQSSPRILVLSPTRELAQQTAREAEWLSRYMDISVATLVGASTCQPRSARSRTVRHRRGHPRKDPDHVNRGTLRTDGIHSIILDEGDHMLDMGFRDELEGILDAFPSGNGHGSFPTPCPGKSGNSRKSTLPTLCPSPLWRTGSSTRISSTGRTSFPSGIKWKDS